MDFLDNRRKFLYQSLTGLGGLALLDLLNQDLLAGSTDKPTLAGDGKTSPETL